MTVGDLLDRASSSELTDWQAYERMHGPLGPERGDLQAAIVASVVANVNRDKKKGRAFKPADFMPKFAGNRPGARTPDEMRTKLLALTRQFGGTIEGDAS